MLKYVMIVPKSNPIYTVLGSSSIYIHFYIILNLLYISFTFIHYCSVIVMMKESSRKQAAAAPCAACKLLRRRCGEDCMFAPYFPADEPHKFASVHKVFGASNVNKMLQELPEHQRGDAISSMVYEANARVRDPVYGCVGAISSLQQQIEALQTQLALAQAEVVHMRMRQYSCMNNSPDRASPSSRGKQSLQARSLFDMDMDMVMEHTNMDESFWP